ncbi:hypothetical protein VCHA48O428_110040 [Vibrio chagasii]|nr:hypothetical protein VCHA36P166_140130 [Vibrio chagasii]CAH6934756.1 hypothetical protein VCHA48O428_110040 [Vibrio chagasii]CAH7254240.1 hypothetical protein VCHA41O245_170071 [Vibrio chagasii]CAH7388299.1 hypothetical protein VCHA55P509_80135 [Vibrio chagasii]CAH7476693.1 hypothetical protein VCHA54P501_60045 [Vibrio chagasii]
MSWVTGQIPHKWVARMSLNDNKKTLSSTCDNILEVHSL